MAGGLFSSAFGTAVDRPKEYGPHWGGFSDRYGMRTTGIVTGNGIEAGIGLFLHEDPRYLPMAQGPIKLRVRNAIRFTFVARHNDSAVGPAYARYIGIIGNNFLSNTWRVQSEANTHDAILRTVEGFAGRMAPMPSRNFGQM